MTDEMLAREARIAGEYDGAHTLLEVLLHGNPDLFTDRGYRVLDRLRDSIEGATSLAVEDAESGMQDARPGLYVHLRAAIKDEGAA